MQQKALREIDAHLAHTGQHVGAVDILGHRLDAHDARHVDKAAHSRRVQRMLDQAADELSGDLQAVHRQHLQVAERRSAGAEIVQCHAHAHRPHPRNESGGVGQVGDGHGLGDLQAQTAAAILARCTEHFERPPMKFVVADRLSGQVDAELPHPLRAGVQAQPVERVLQHPAIDARRQLVALGRRQESTRRNQLAVSAQHANQHLGMQSIVCAGQRCDALRIQGEPVFVQRLFDARSPPRLAAA